MLESVTCMCCSEDPSKPEVLEDFGQPLFPEMVQLNLFKEKLLSNTEGENVVYLTWIRPY